MSIKLLILYQVVRAFGEDHWSPLTVTQKDGSLTREPQTTEAPLWSTGSSLMGQTSTASQASSPQLFLKQSSDVNPFNLGSNSREVQRRASGSGRDARAIRSPFAFVTSGMYFITDGYLGNAFSIYFYVKTLQRNCHLLSVSPWDEQFQYFPFRKLVFQLIDGYLEAKIAFQSFNPSLHPSSHPSFQASLASDPAKEDMFTMKVPAKKPCNEGHWHLVGFQRIHRDSYELSLNNLSRTETFSSFEKFRGEVRVKVHVGGQPKDASSPENEGLQGCLASLALGNQLLTPGTSFIEVPETFQGLIRQGCEEEEDDDECGKTECENEGVCSERHGVRLCDCEFTSFRGETCHLEGSSFAFGLPGGLLSLNFFDWQRTDEKTDRLVFRVQTNLSNSIMLRVISSNSNEYLQVEVMDGNVFVVYNMGLVDHVIGELSGKVDDAKPHVVRVLRVGANVTLRIDHWPPVHRNPSGRQRSVFNQISEIMVGAKKDSMGSLVRPFEGLIGGLVYNGVEVMEQVLEDDSRAVLHGNVALHKRSQPLKPRMAKKFSSKHLLSSEIQNSSLKSTKQSNLSDKCQQPSNCHSEDSNGNNTIKSSHLCNNNNKCNLDIPAGDSIQSNLSTSHKLLPVPSDNLTFTPSPTIHQSTGDHQQTTDSSLALNKSQDPRSESSTRRLAMTLIIVSIVGSLLGIILLALFGAYAGYRYRTRNEGSYKIENNRSYGGYEICSLKPSNPAVKSDRTLNGRVKNSATKDRKRNQEWYV